MAEVLPSQPESDFKPAVDAAELLAANQSAFDQMPSAETYQHMPDRSKAAEAAKDQREAKRQDLLTQGYDAKEAASIINSGFVVPELFAHQDPSAAYLEAAAQSETAKAKSDVPEAQAKLDYAVQRSELVAATKRSGSQGYSDGEIERIVTYGHLMPPEYSATPAADLLEQHRHRGRQQAA